MAASRPLAEAPDDGWPECASLASGLQIQLDLHLALERAVRALGDATLRRDVTAVGRAVSEQEQVAARLVFLAAQVREDTRTLASRLGLPRDAAFSDVLDALCAAGRSPSASAFSAQVGRIRATSAACARGNAQNAALLRQALAYTSFALRVLTVAGTGIPGYTGTGARQPPVRRLVDTHA